MEKVKTYNKRAWLSPDTHSTAYVHCYNDPDCLNPDWPRFVRIADCRRVFDIRWTEESPVDAITILTGIIDVLESKCAEFVFTKRGQTNTILFNNTKEGVGFVIYTTFPPAYQLADITSLVLHCDTYTCSLTEWKSKIAILTDELKAFVEFLKSLNQATANEE